MLDSHLKFEKHVKMVSKVAKANLHTFRLIRDCLPYHAANSFMHSMIFSYLGYCVTSWSHAASTTIKPLMMIYDQAIQILDRKSIRSHHCHVLKKFNMLIISRAVVSWSTGRLVGRYALVRLNSHWSNNRRVTFIRREVLHQ